MMALIDGALNGILSSDDPSDRHRLGDHLNLTWACGLQVKGSQATPG